MLSTAVQSFPKASPAAQGFSFVYLRAFCGGRFSNFSPTENSFTLTRAGLERPQWQLLLRQKQIPDSGSWGSHAKQSSTEMPHRQPGRTCRRSSCYFRASALPAVGQTSVTTYHNDNYRTGWNQTESVLTPAKRVRSNVRSAPDRAARRPGRRAAAGGAGSADYGGELSGHARCGLCGDENNSVYAIDVHTGAVLLSPNFGSPVRYPLGCNNNGPNVGVNSTPGDRQEQQHDVRHGLQPAFERGRSSTNFTPSIWQFDR